MRPDLIELHYATAKEHLKIILDTHQVTKLILMNSLEADLAAPPWYSPSPVHISEPETTHRKRFHLTSET